VDPVSAEETASRLPMGAAVVVAAAAKAAGDLALPRVLLAAEAAAAAPAVGIARARANVAHLEEPDRAHVSKKYSPVLPVTALPRGVVTTRRARRPDRQEPRSPAKRRLRPRARRSPSSTSRAPSAARPPKFPSSLSKGDKSSVSPATEPAKEPPRRRSRGPRLLKRTTESSNSRFF
jgi:hypothetical protein